MRPFKPTSEQMGFAAMSLKKAGVVDSNGEFAEEFKSCFSSFAAVVSQSGFAAALTYFENQDSDAKVRRGLPVAVKAYLVRSARNRYANLSTLSSEYARCDSSGKRSFEEDVINAATVLKIALRMYAPKKVESWQPSVAYGSPTALNNSRGRSGNLGYLFNHSEAIPVQDNRMLSSSVQVNRQVINDLSKGFSVRRMRVSAPGLIIGGGISHVAAGNDAVKTGLRFDWTSGLPVIPGSSVKGVVRSVFPDDDTDGSQMRYILGLLVGIGAEGFKDVDASSKSDVVAKLRDNMFGKAGLKGADVFADALVTGLKGNGRVIEKDVLTPHTRGPLAEPVPINIVKVCSGVEFSFCYKFTEFRSGKINISADDKLKLCTAILQDMGIGAKTNVGYGCLEALD